MLANKLMSALSGGAEDKLYVDDVFSAFTYTGNGSTQTINNGIDLAGKGGLVWSKSRGAPRDHSLFDTARGMAVKLLTNLVNGNHSATTEVTSFNSNGYSLGESGQINLSGESVVSWTFRKAPKFFDVVTYTGNGVAGRQIPHELGIAPGMVILKRTNTALDWMVYHIALGATKNLKLNTTAAEQVASYPWNNTEPTSSVFTVNNTGYDNANGDTYVAYLFAHDPSADGIIQCGSFTGGGGVDVVNLGWEPQYILFTATEFGSWYVLDTARELSMTKELQLNPNASDGESYPGSYLRPTATGFTIQPNYLGTGVPAVYMAIRRPNKPPTSGTEVYNAIARTGTGAAATVTGVGFTPDLAIVQKRLSTAQAFLEDRLRGAKQILYPSTTAAESSDTVNLTAFNMDGITLGAGAASNGTGYSYINHFFRRAPGFMDVVCYTGTDANPFTLSHNLEAVPELIIHKNRSGSGHWSVYVAAGLGATKAVRLNTTEAASASSRVIKSTPSAATFTVDDGGTYSATQSGTTYVAYLFATKPGISKVGSYTGNGTTQTINCGFTTGARFILIKRTDATGDWYVWDTARGIVAGNDPHLSLNTTATEVTTDDSVDPDVSGFIVNQVAATNINVSGGQYIFLAIA